MKKVPKLEVFSRVLFIAMAMFGVTNVAQGDTVVRAIVVEANDAEEHINLSSIHLGPAPQGFVDTGSSDLEIASEGDAGLDWQAIGVQWDTLGIPQGSTINSATITFTVDNAGAAGDNNLTILAEDVDNSTTFVPTSVSTALPLDDITLRTRSTASVAWAPAPNDVVGTTVVTPDISALIQAIVDRSGWSPNNLLTIMIFPDVYLALPDPTTGGSTVLQELELEAGPGADSATLTVDFTPPPPAPTVVSFTSNDDLAAGTATWNLEFSEDVDGVTSDDFSLISSLGPITGDAPTVLAAKALGTSYVVTVTGITGTGFLRVFLDASGSGIENSTALPLVTSSSSDVLNNGVMLPTAGVVGLLILSALMCVVFVRTRRKAAIRT